MTLNFWRSTNQMPDAGRVFSLLHRSKCGILLSRFITIASTIISQQRKTEEYPQHTQAEKECDIWRHLNDTKYMMWKVECVDNWGTY